MIYMLGETGSDTNMHANIYSAAHLCTRAHTYTHTQNTEDCMFMYMHVLVYLCKCDGEDGMGAAADIIHLGGSCHSVQYTIHNALCNW